MEYSKQLVPKQLSPLKAAWLLLLRFEDYVPAAFEHSLAVSLKKPDILEAFLSGNYPRADWESETKSNLRQ